MRTTGRMDALTDSQIWISPVTFNFEGTSAYGQAYHGFWQQDLYRVNSNFGTAQDLKNLAAALHARGMVKHLIEANIKYSRPTDRRCDSTSWWTLLSTTTAGPVPRTRFNTQASRHLINNPTITHIAPSTTTTKTPLKIAGWVTPVSSCPICEPKTQPSLICITPGSNHLLPIILVRCFSSFGSQVRYLRGLIPPLYNLFYYMITIAANYES
jgi:hypothetical protein